MHSYSLDIMLGLLEVWVLGAEDLQQVRKAPSHPASMQRALPQSLF